MIFHAFNPSSRCQKSQVKDKQRPQPHLLHGIDVLAWFQSPRALIDSCMLNCFQHKHIDTWTVWSVFKMRLCFFVRNTMELISN